jgi:hypothetical protein
VEKGPERVCEGERGPSGQLEACAHWNAKLGASSRSSEVPCSVAESLSTWRNLPGCMLARDGLVWCMGPWEVGRRPDGAGSAWNAALENVLSRSSEVESKGEGDVSWRPACCASTSVAGLAHVCRNTSSRGETDPEPSSSSLCSDPPVRARVTCTFSACELQHC